jgi:hypothetical protein
VTPIEFAAWIWHFVGWSCSSYFPAFTWVFGRPKPRDKEVDAAQIEGATRRAPAAGPRGHNTRPAPQVITRRASEIRPEPIAWLWKYWLARGKFAGDAAFKELVVVRALTVLRRLAKRGPRRQMITCHN